MEEILRFYKENNNWYADIPTWTGRKSALEMVAGADTLLDKIANGKTETYLRFSPLPIINGECLIYKSKTWFNGANYILDSYKKEEINLNVWLCNVTKFVMGKFPKKIYFKEVNLKLY